MSSSTPPPLTIVPASAADRPAVLEVVLWDFPPNDRQQYVRTLLAADSQFSLDGLLEARRRGQLVGAIWSQLLSSGATAGLWPPRLVAGEPESTAQALLDAALQFLQTRPITLVQSLLKPDDRQDARRIADAGFDHLSDLAYLVSLESHFPATPPAQEVEFESYDESQFSRLLGLVERTYEQTLDCPGLNGLRPTTEVLAEYRATGRFDPRLWLIVRHDGTDVGCVLVADHPGVPQWELMYMGLVIEARGHGWGRQIVQYVQWLARQAGRQRIVLAVDQANAPACAAYTATGFTAWDHRSVWLKLLKQPSAVNRA